MAQRPQPSLRFADGGSFITRWAQSVMRPDAAAKRLREADAPPPQAPPPAPVRPPAPPPPPPNPNATPDNPTGIRFQDGGHVPGTGEGDKIPAKYEPGEFVVSNDMIDDNPGLREGLSQMRAETLAARGRTVEEADAKALRYHGGLRGGEHGQESTQRSDAFSGSSPQREGTSVHVGAEMDGGVAGDSPGGAGTRGTDLPPGGRPQVSLRAVDGFDPIDRMARGLTGQNPLPPRSPVGNMAQDLTQNARATPPPFDATRNFTPPPSSMPAGPSSNYPRQFNVPPSSMPPGPSSNYPRQFNVPPSSMPPGPSSSLAGGAAEAAHGERVNPTLKPSNPAFHGDGRYGAPASATATAPAVPPTQGGLRGAIDGAKGFLGGAGASAGSVGGALKSVGGGALGLAKGAITSPLGVGLAAGQTTYDGFNTDTEQYARRFGLENTEPGFARDLGVRALGVASDAGNALTFGLAKKFLYRDDSDPAAAMPDTLRKSTPYADANAAKIAALDAQNKAAAPAAPAASQNTLRRIDAPGQSPLFTNVPDGGQFGNDSLMSRGQISPQNMAAADALAGTQQRESMARVQAGMQAQPQQPSEAASLRQQATNMLASRELGSRKNARLLLETANNMEQSADRRYGADTSLRGTMYSADAQLGGKQMDSQRRLREQQLTGMLWRESGGDPSKFQSLAMQYGLADTAKLGGDMAQTEQSRAQSAATSASKRLEGLAVRDDGKGGSVVDPGRLARLESTLGKMAPGWQHMSEREQAKHLATAEAGINLLEGLNDRRNNSFWQSIGVDGASASLDNLPIESMKGGKLRDVGLKEGALTGGGVSRGDYVIEVNGQKLYLPRSKVNQGELELLKSRGVDISGLQK